MTDRRSGPLDPLAAAAPLSHFSALILALDDVIVPTTPLHAAAWKRVCDDMLEELSDGEPFVPFDLEADYRTNWAGRTSFEGLTRFFEGRGVTVEEGHPDDPETVHTRHGLVRCKARRFEEEVDRDGVDVYPSSLEVAAYAREHGLKLGLVSESPYAGHILTAAGIDHLFDRHVDLRKAAQPAATSDGDAFLAAAAGLGTPAARSIVATARTLGVRAARAGQFGLAIAVDRSPRMTTLRAAAADLLVSDLGELLPGGGPPSARACLPAIAAGLGAPGLALSIALDEVLPPAMAGPGDVGLAPELRDPLDRLTRHLPVVVLSARPTEDLARHVGLKGPTCLGGGRADAGETLRSIRASAAARLVVHIGGEESDADLFPGLKGLGIGIRVTPDPVPTSAAFRLRDAADLAGFLEDLAAVAAERPGLA